MSNLTFGRKRPQLIFLTGSLDVGKTTLLNELAQDPQVTVVREVAQDLIDLYGYDITQQPEFQDLVFSEQLAREAASLAAGKPFVLCDRGTVDIVGFCRVIGVPIKPEWQASLTNRYDAVAVFNKDDIAFQPELYDVPFDMAAYRDQVDSSIRSVLAEAKLPFVEIAGTHQVRLKQFRELMSELGVGEGSQQDREGKPNKKGSRERY